MNKKLTKMLKKEKKYTLDTYTILVPKLKKNRIVLPFLILFFAVTIVFILDTMGVVDLELNFILYFIAFMLFVAFPLSTIKEYRKEILIVTPELLIRRSDSKVYEIVDIDNITSFMANDEMIVVSDRRDSLEIGLVKYERYIPILVEILESKGKTFDKGSDFMLRPIEIICDGQTIKVQDIKEDETNVERITRKLTSRYNYVTPGFISQIVPKNSVVQKAYVKGNDLYLEVNHLEINGEHPDNTSFGAIQVLSGVMVFLDVNMTHLSKKAGNERNIPYNDIDISLDYFISQLERSVVFEWKFNNQQADLIFTVGVGKIKTAIEFEEIVVGWVKEKNSK